MSSLQGRAPRHSRALTPSLLRPFTAFSYPAYRLVWLNSSFVAFGVWAQRLATGWLVLEQTDSVLLSAATIGVGSAPGIIMAPIGGAVADRFPRNRLLQMTAFVRALTILGMGLVALRGFDNPLPIFVLIAISGTINSFEMPAKQVMITDIVPREFRMNAISVHSVGTMSVAAVGALGSGVISEISGTAYALFAASGSIFIAGVFVLFLPDIRASVERTPTPVTGIFRDAVGGLRSIMRMPTVATILWMAVVVEIFGFAHDAVMPAMARDELGVTESGLGTLRFASGIGAVCGAIGLATLGDFRRKGHLLIGITFGYGIGLMGVAVSPNLMVAIGLIALVGASASMFDAMQWTLLQANVPNRLRGRVIGGWVFAIGFGWVGHLTMGAIGDAFGVRIALGGAGLVVALTAVALLVVSPRFVSARKRTSS